MAWRCKAGSIRHALPPIGYDVVDRKLVPNPQEADIVREIFARYAAVPSVGMLLRDLRSRGVTTKSWTTRKGVERKGNLIDRGYIYKIFNNPVYIGIAAYKGQHYPGQHEAIIERSLWDTVQELLESGRTSVKGRQEQRETKGPSLLRGLLFSETGSAFTPGWTVKGQKYYRYYINTDAIRLGKDACEVRRMPAGEIEAVVVEKLRQLLRSPEVLSQAIREVTSLRPRLREPEAIDTLRSIDAVWDELFQAEQARIAQTLIDRITVRKEGISIVWKTEGMPKLLRAMVEPKSVEEVA